jgi:hypothetical protein
VLLRPQQASQEREAPALRVHLNKNQAQGLEFLGPPLPLVGRSGFSLKLTGDYAPCSSLIKLAKAVAASELATLRAIYHVPENGKKGSSFRRNSTTSWDTTVYTIPTPLSHASPLGATARRS